MVIFALFFFSKQTNKQTNKQTKDLEYENFKNNPIFGFHNPIYIRLRD